MRLFAAVDLSPSLQSAVAQTQDLLKTCGCDVAWIQPSLAHVTLRFFGNVKEDSLHDMNSRLAAALHGIAPLEMTLVAAGAFPDVKAPRILWLGVDKGAKELGALYKAIENALADFHLEKTQNPFHAHITLGRVRRPGGLHRLSKKLLELPALPAMGQKVEAVTLYESVISHQGPRYIAKNKFNLAGYGSF